MIDKNNLFNITLALMVMVAGFLMLFGVTNYGVLVVTIVIVMFFANQVRRYGK